MAAFRLWLATQPALHSSACLLQCGRCMDLLMFTAVLVGILRVSPHSRSTSMSSIIDRHKVSHIFVSCLLHGADSCAVGSSLNEISFAVYFRGCTCTIYWSSLSSASPLVHSGNNGVWSLTDMESSLGYSRHRRPIWLATCSQRGTS